MKYGGNPIANASIIGVFSGMASRATGGDFYEGAMRGAFVYLYNDLSMKESFRMLWKKMTNGEIGSDAIEGVIGGAKGLHQIMTMDASKVKGGFMGKHYFNI